MITGTQSSFADKSDGRSEVCEGNLSLLTCDSCGCGISNDEMQVSTAVVVVRLSVVDGKEAGTNRNESESAKWEEKADGREWLMSESGDGTTDGKADRGDLLILPLPLLFPHSPHKHPSP